MWVTTHGGVKYIVVVKGGPYYIHGVQARSQGGGGRGGRTTPPPPQLPIPKILFHPLAILFHPLAILFHLSAILFHPLAILFHPSAILFHPLAILFHPSAILFHPLAILFHPWNMDDVTRAMSKGGGCLWMSKSGGVFQIDDVTRAMSKGGGVRLVFHPSKFRPPPPGWLATGLVCNMDHDHMDHDCQKYSCQICSHFKFC